MRVVGLLLLVLIAAFLIGGGMVYFRHSDDSLSVHIDQEKLHRETGELRERAEVAGKRLASETENAVDKLREDIRKEQKGSPRSIGNTATERHTTTVEESTAAPYNGTR